jgi:hypothetical protein
VGGVRGDCIPSHPFAVGYLECSVSPNIPDTPPESPGTHPRAYFPLPTRCVPHMTPAEGGALNGGHLRVCEGTRFPHAPHSGGGYCFFDEVKKTIPPTQSCGTHPRAYFPLPTRCVPQVTPTPPGRVPGPQAQCTEGGVLVFGKAEHQHPTLLIPLLPLPEWNAGFCDTVRSRTPR